MAFLFSVIAIATAITTQVDVQQPDSAPAAASKKATSDQTVVSPKMESTLEQIEQLKRLRSDNGRLREEIRQLQARLDRTVRQRLEGRQQQLRYLTTRLPHPGRRVEERLQRLDELELRRNHAMQHSLRHRVAEINMFQQRLQKFSPLQRLAQYRLQNQNLGQRLLAALRHQLRQQQQSLQHLAHALDTVSPLATLSRGYAIVTTATGDKILRSATDVEPGETIHTRLAKGRLISTVTDIDESQDN